MVVSQCLEIVNNLQTLHILICYILLTILTQRFYNTVVIILNNIKPNGIPLHSVILCCMWYTVALMALMMVVD